jgi:hypothetical protein
MNRYDSKPQKPIVAVLATGLQAAAHSSFPAPISLKTSGSSGGADVPSTMLRKDYGRETQ